MKTKVSNRNDKLALAIQKFIALHYSDKIKKVIVKYNSRTNLYLVKIFINNDRGIISRLAINFSLFSKIRTVFNINNFKVEEVSFMEKFVILDKLKDIKTHI
jgi:hypothetical protein